MGSTEPSSSNKVRRVDDAESGNVSSAEKPAERKTRKRTIGSTEPASSSQDHRSATRYAQGSAFGLLQEDNSLGVGYYNANFNHVVRGAGVGKPDRPSRQAIDKWLEHCKEDVGNAIREDDLLVVCLVGLGVYNKGLGKLLSAWIKHYHQDDHSLCLLHYITNGLPGK